MPEINTEFIEAVDQRFNASACINCGACTAVCPTEIGLLPRHLFRHVLLGLEEKVLEDAEVIFSCLLCRMCEVNCAADVPIAENVRVLRNYINIQVDGLGR